jgi:hypothetical protein
LPSCALARREIRLGVNAGATFTQGIDEAKSVLKAALNFRFGG